MTFLEVVTVFVGRVVVAIFWDSGWLWLVLSKIVDELIGSVE
jgi:hypothetical protein